MITVLVGTDAYGRVKIVSGTPIVTKFAMLHFLPVYPLQSFYLARLGPSGTTGMPLIARVRTTAIVGLPLASVDKVVLAAYVRAVFAAMALVGALALVPGIMYLTGEHLDVFALMATRGLLISLVIGTLGGILTYLTPLMPCREKDIRRCCAELLDIAADPARLPSDMGNALVQYVDEKLPRSDSPRERLIRDLIVTRATLAQATDADGMEAKTDELLDRLRHTEHLVA